MLAALLLLAAAADPETAIGAERAFNAAAQAKGQWTAFREFAADDAVMFVPQVVNAQQWLKDRADPPKSVEWWPAESYISCDGKVAVNTGGWKRPDGSVGYFTTVWMLQADGSWKWLLDHGDTLPRARPAAGQPAIHRAQCSNLPGPDEGIVRVGPQVTISGEGTSPDRSLLWEWHVMPDNSRSLLAHFWTDEGYEPMLIDMVDAPK